MTGFYDSSAAETNLPKLKGPIKNIVKLAVVTYSFSQESGWSKSWKGSCFDYYLIVLHDVQSSAILLT